MRKVDFESLVKETLPEGVRSLLIEAGSLAGKKGVSVHLVGGVVRDLILGRQNLDIDLVVEGDGLLFAQELGEGLGADLDIHHPFLTATLTLAEGLRVDVATARAEEYAEPAALPQVRPAAIKDDLRRRDFTINALAVRIGRGGVGELLDPFGGYDDLRKGLIRVLHERSFIDDPTRIFRAVRYQVRFGFRPDDLTLRFLRKAVSDNMVEKLSGERIRNEIWLLFEEERAAQALGLLEKLRVLRHIHPSLEFIPEMATILTELQSLLSQLKGRLKADLRLVSLFPLLETVRFDLAVEIGKRLSLKRRELEKIAQLKLSLASMAELSSKKLKPSQVASLLRGLSPEFLLFAMAQTKNEVVRENIRNFIDSYRETRLTIGGKDLKTLGIPEGPAYKEILGEVLDAKLDGLVGTKEEEIVLARRLYQTRQE